MVMSEFWELYKRPEWQKKRLEVMQASGFACSECFAKDKTLNVHHRFYKKGSKPWEYDTAELACLCETCHEIASEKLRDIRKLVGDVPINAMDRVLGFIKGVLLREEVYASIEYPNTYEHLSGISMAFCLDEITVKECSSRSSCDELWLADGEKLNAAWVDRHLNGKGD
jgi:hypothetical protein